ncbi:MAG TPA: Ig-like domain repeat protein [Edaphobacter sp.]|nr:Ig-like domain repeat protein [Edaphobacter sp.]
MGTQSITHPPRASHVPLRIALLLLLFLTLPPTASAQTASVSAITVSLILPSAIVFDATGNLYIAETGNHIIRKVDSTGNITTIAGTGTQGFSGDAGPATSATLDSPQGIALDTKNNLYIADTHNHRVRKLNLTTGIITTIAGATPGFSGDTALATSAQLNLPTALALDAADNLYFADTGNHRIRKITATTGIITTIAGNGTQGFSGDAGPAIAATIDSPTGLALDTANNLYLADTHNHRVRKITATTGIISTIAGTGAQGFSGDTTASTSATLALPHGITIDSAGNLYLADTQNHRIRRIDATTGIITTVAGDGTQAFAGDGGPAIAASLDTPRAAALSPSTLLTLADTGNQRIRQLEAAPAPATTIHTIAGLGLTAPGALTLTAPSVIAYGTGQITATLASTTNATGAITFLDTTNDTPGDATTSTSTLGTATLASNIATLPTTTLPAGHHNLTATYAGDQTHSSAQSSALALTITPRQLNITITPTTLLYGQSIPGISGTIIGVLPQDASNLSAAFATDAIVFSPAGTYPITGTLTGSAAGNYAIPSPAATLTINPATTSITLSNLIANVTTGSSITLTAHVASTTSGTPTGSVTLLDGSVTLSTTPLSATGDAVFTIPSITQGQHSFTALYAGSTNFTPSVSAPQLITGGTGSPDTSDFALTPNGTTTQTIPSGSSADYTFTVQLQGNMSSPITLAATGLPNLAKASFNPPIVPPGSTSNSFTLTIATPNTTASNTRSLASPVKWTFLSFPIAVFTLRSCNSRKALRLFLLTLLSLTSLLATGCGDRISTADSLALSAKPYTITVTGTATTPTGSVLQHSTTVTLLLEQPQ